MCSAVIQTFPQCTRTFYWSTHTAQPFRSQYIELCVRDHRIHQDLGQQWKWMEWPMPLQTFFLRKKEAEQDAAGVALEHMNEIKCISFSDSTLSSAAASNSVSLYFCRDEIGVLLFAMVAISNLV